MTDDICLVSLILIEILEWNTREVRITPPVMACK